MRWVYPRTCGGTARGGKVLMSATGLSPHVRGNLDFGHPKAPVIGSIPARAGEPINPGGEGRRSRVYPRTCGGTLDAGQVAEALEGLSPHVRGNLPTGTAARWNPGSIPARAGEPPEQLERLAGNVVYPRTCGGTGG